MRLIAILAAALALTACDQRPEGEPVVRAPVSEDGARPASVEPQPSEADDSPAPPFASACKPASFEGIALTHCIADPAQHRIGTALAPNGGQGAGRIEGWLAGRERNNIAFVVNGGMYGDDLRPIGYFVREEDRLVELNQRSANGNFYLKPNGVFFGTDGEWRVLDSETFVRTIGTRPQFGTQSGPMLVIDGELHPDISENGPSKAIRNGVGIDDEGRAHFVISDEALSFGQLARFYRDELKTPNALFLDGNVSSLFDPASGRMDEGRVGPLLVVERKP